MNPSFPRAGLHAFTAAVCAALVGGCAAPIERFAMPADEGATAEVQLNLMGRSRNRSEAIYVPGAVRCNTLPLIALLDRTVEDPPRLVVGSWDEPQRRVVNLPAGVPLPLRFRREAPGSGWTLDFVVVLQPGARYVFDHDLPNGGFTLKDSATGQPPPRLPARWFHDAVKCPG